MTKLCVTCELAHLNVKNEKVEMIILHTFTAEVYQA